MSRKNRVEDAAARAANRTLRAGGAHVDGAQPDRAANGMTDADEPVRNRASV
jgi:hypothetical protein